jgi:hypothetical protein
MSGEQRLLLEYEMSLFIGELAGAGIGRNHPEWTETMVTRKLLGIAFLPAGLAMARVR